MHLKYKDTDRLEKIRKRCHANSNPKIVGVATLVSDKTDSKMKNIVCWRGNNFILPVYILPAGL